MASSSRRTRARGGQSYAEPSSEEEEDDDLYVHDEPVERPSRKRRRSRFRRSARKSSASNVVSPQPSHSRTRSGRVVKKPSGIYGNGESPPEPKRTFSRRLSARRSGAAAREGTPQRLTRSSSRLNSVENDVPDVSDDEGEGDDGDMSAEDSGSERKRPRMNSRRASKEEDALVYSANEEESNYEPEEDHVDGQGGEGGPGKESDGDIVAQRPDENPIDNADDDGGDVDATAPKREPVKMRVNLRFPNPSGGEPIRINHAANGVPGSASNPNENESDESEVPIRRTRGSDRKRIPEVEEQIIDGNDKDDEDDEEFQMPSEADAGEEDDSDEDAVVEEESSSNSGSSEEFEGVVTRNRKKRASAPSPASPAKRPRRETRSSALPRRSRRTPEAYQNSRKSYPSRAVRTTSKRRESARAAERNRRALASYRPKSGTLRAQDFYDKQSTSGDSSTSDDDFHGSGQAGVLSPRPPAAGGAGPSTTGKPDFFANPMALMDNAGSNRPRPSRYARRRNRNQQAGIDPFAMDPHGKGRGQRKVAGIEPIQVDLSLKWEDIGGLDHHIRALKEMVFLPLMYPEIFEKFQMEPPKGVLFYGPPGTGKTLCARTLAASCGGDPVEEEAPVAGADAVHAALKAVTKEGATKSTAPMVPDSFIVGSGENGADSGPSGITLEGAGSKVIPDSVKNNPALQQAAAGLLSAAAKESTSPAATSHAQAPSGKRDPTAAGSIPSVEPPKKARRPRVAFFMRNGADCLSKWVGEAERQLRMTFEAAKTHQPAIIFFDEIDGLAPVRSSKQDQIHSSIVSTLLGLMDGLDSRGKIVVIGATNRVDAIDPALRRPGRFDRELIFTLPNCKARRRILDIQTAHWKPKPPHPKVLDAVAARTVGYCGADIRALCAESTLRAVRRRYPQIYNSQDKLLIDVNEVRVTNRDFTSAMNDIVPASHRSARTHARPLPARLTAVLSKPLRECVDVIRRIFPQGMPPGSEGAAQFASLSAGALPNGIGTKENAVVEEDDDGLSDVMSDDDFDEKAFESALGSKVRSVYGQSGSALRERPVLRPRLLLCGRPGLGQAQLGPALLHFLEGCPVHAIDMPSLHMNSSARTPEEALVTAVREACRAAPSVLYLPHLHLWWKTAHESLRTTLLITLRDIPADLPLLFLATGEEDFDSLPSELTELFAEYVCLVPSLKEHRAEMFAPLVDQAVAVPAVSEAILRKKRNQRRNEVLPKAPPPPPKVLTPAQTLQKSQEDDRYIRELRMGMRGFVESLLRERKFKAFWTPVDPSTAPDYYAIVKEPMDISKIAAQIDKGMYPTVASMVRDFDLMVKNAVTYNPAHTEEGAAILRRAHGLVDIVHAWVDNLNPLLVERCNRIVAWRLQRQAKQNEEEAKKMAVVEDSLKAGAEKAEVAKDGDTEEVILDGSTAADKMEVDTIVVREGAQGALVGNSVRLPKRLSGDRAQLEAEKVAAAAAKPATVTVTKRIRSSSPPPIVANGRPPVEAEKEETVPESPAKPADEAKVSRLRRLLAEVTSGISVDGLEGLHVRCATLLFKFRYTRDREMVVEQLTRSVMEARDDPAVVGQLVE